jgi:hypothetical protein
MEFEIGWDFSREEWTPKIDVNTFISILLEISVHSNDDIPIFISEMIEGDERIGSFNDIFEMLKQNGFEILSGVDCDEVCDFVKWIESIEQSIS